MMPAKRLFSVLVFCLLIAGCKTLSFKGVVAPPPLIPGATFVGAETCAMCHEKISKDFDRTTHSRLVVSSAEVQGQACEACHGPGSLHADAEGKLEKRATIVNPGKKPEACFKCHLDKKAEFNLQYHHPVPEGKMSCVDCHDPHSDEGVRPGTTKSLAGKNALCAKCHIDQTRPFVYEHEALREGCTVCHNVHGSINDKMLKERDVNLCLKCHYQTQLDPTEFNIADRNHGGATGYLTRGPCFSAGCHIAVHGSNYSERFRL